MITEFKEALRYGTASAFALVVDMSMLWGLVNFASFGYVIAASISYLTGAVVVYQLSIRLVFKHHRLEDRRAELGAFVAIGIAGLAINSTVIFVMAHYLEVHYLVAKCAAAGLTFSFNYIGRRQLLFVPRPITRVIGEHD